MIKSLTSLAVCFALISVVPLGCEAPELSDAAKSSSTPAAAAPDPTSVDVAGLPGEPLPEDPLPVTDVPRKLIAQDPVKGRRSRQAAAEGYSLGIATTAAAGLYAKHQMIYQSIDYANQLYNPQHDFNYPPTHEAFMKDVAALALNGVPLPELAAGREYIYVPEMGELGLMIRLTPGSPGSKLPKAEPGKEHIYDYNAVAAAGVNVPGLQADGTLDEIAAMAAAKAAAQDPSVQPEANIAGPASTPSQPAADIAAPVSQPAAEQPVVEQPAAEEPVYSIRERAGLIGGQADQRTQEALEGGP
jgi:hypothetical protein